MHREGKAMESILFHLAQELGDELTTQNLKIATAESCTGGGLGYWLTSVPGSSTWYKGGFIAYTPDAKLQMLGVKPEVLSAFGTVSEHTARDMAEGTLEKNCVDLSVAITGVAGPGGGTKENPVGTVWLAIARRDFATETWAEYFKGDRQSIRLQAIQKALEKLLEAIHNKVEKVPTI